MNSENKQFVAVSIFMLVIVLTIAALATSTFSSKKRDYSVTPVAVNSNEPVPEVKQSEPIQIVTSNTNNSSTTTYSNNNSGSTTSSTNTSTYRSNTYKPSNNSGNSTNTGNSGSKKPGVIPVSYSIINVDANKVYVGGSANISVTIKPDNATNKSVSYSSSNTSIAKVTEYGKIIGINPGKCKITVKAGGSSSSFEFQVLKRPVSSNSNSNKPSNSNSNTNNRIAVQNVSLNTTSLKLAVKNTYTLKATISPSNATNKNVTWTSSNSNVATVSNGIVTAKNAGTTTITVTTRDGNRKASCVVTVYKPTTVVKVTSVSLSNSALTIKKGLSAQLSAIVNPSNATNKSVSWSSSNTNVAIVSNGTIIAKGAGTTIITVTTVDGGKSATCFVTVLPNTIHVTGVTISKSSLSLNTNSSASIYATVSPSNATNKSVTWSSSNTKVATVSGGLIKAVGAGTATITVKTNDGGKTATCKVTVTNAPVKVSGVKLNRSSVSINEKATTQLTATVSPSNAANKSVTWSSSNTSVATVSSSGVITGKKAGTATITVKTKDGGKKATCKVTVNALKNGWKTEGGKDYYYVNGKKLTNQFKGYRYLGSDGAAIAKMGSFEITTYKSTAWVAASQLYIYEKASTSSKYLGYVVAGDKITILSAESNGMIKMNYGKTTGWVSIDYIFINLPDVMPSMTYKIPAASSTGLTMTSGGYKIPGVTGKKYYKFSKAYNAKIERNEYYAPFLYPAAKKLQSALSTAKKQGYSFAIYDTYRPRWVEEDEYNKYMKLYNSNATVRAAINKTVNGFTYSLGWFMTTGASKHCQGHAVDLALMKDGKELKAQCPVDTLDTSAVIEYNNSVSKKLNSLMTGVGFTSLRSEWWHFDLRNTNYNNSYYHPYYSFNIYN